jgi:hypothetical protein
MDDLGDDRRFKQQERLATKGLSNREVASTDTPRRGARSAPAILDRLVFKTSRLGEFCSKRELINQTGHGFGYCPNGPAHRRIITGINWSVSIGADPFRRLGPGGESLAAILTEQRAGSHEPIVTVLHVGCPQIRYLDRGKSSVAIPGSRTW